jgi:ABC-type multidrug transport system fused ATPase/permease subunit
MVAVTIALLSLTTWCAYLMNQRLYRTSETALATIRTTAFRHIHALSILDQQEQRRGALVARVTTDVDQISQFLQQGGLTVILAGGQLLVTTVVMLAYSWQLTVAVYVAFTPLVLAVRLLQRRLSGRYTLVRQRVGAMLAAVAESVVGASVIRSYGVAARTATRLDDTIEATRAAQYRAQRVVVVANQAGELAGTLATVAVIVGGVVLGAAGQLTVGQITAFVFLVTLFVQPVQIATEVFNDAQNAIAGWRRVLDVLDTAVRPADPATAGRPPPAGPIAVDFDAVSYAYPGGPLVLHEVCLSIVPGRRVAVVGQTGSGKTTLAKLLVRLMDPSCGQVRISGVPLDQVPFAVLRRRVAMVPQDGFLFAGTLAENVAFGADDDPVRLQRAFADLELTDWLTGLPAGLSTEVGERGEALSVGERQLVALVRAYLVDPDLLVLDEATSAVDPGTEVRLARALSRVMSGRTTVAIAHRLSTAEAADEVVVVDHGRIVQRGSHTELVAEAGSVYARLHESWLEQTR